MRQHERIRKSTPGPIVVALAAIGIAASSIGAMAAQPVTSPAAPDSHNLQWLGHADLQGRTAYQPTLHTQMYQGQNHVFLYVGHFGNQPPIADPTSGGALESNGTSIVDVTSPANPVQVAHIPSNGSQMVRVCDGRTGVLGTTGQYYMLRNTSNTHEVWNVTDPVNPVRTAVIQPAPGAFFTNTHKNWWECDTGIAYLVAGAGAASAAPDGWRTNQHIKVYDISNPSNPLPIRDIGLVGQNPPCGAACTATTATGGVHGPISIWHNPANPGEEINRIYIMFGIPLQHYQGFVSNTTRDLVALISEETDNHCNGSPHFGYLVDTTRAIGKGAASAGENHPMVISTMQTFEDSAKPDFCTRGTRFLNHSTNESFYLPYYGKLLFIANFDAGLRVWDMRDPYHPQEVAHFIPPLNANVLPTVFNGQTFFDVSTDNAEVDDNGLIYIVDRLGGGADILQLNGCAKQIVDNNGTCNANSN